MNEPDFRVTFRVGKRVWVIRALMWGILIMCGLFVYMIAGMPLGEDPEVGLGEEIALIIFVVLISIGFPLGMHIYGRCYVARVIANEDESVSFYDTIGWFGFPRTMVRLDEQGAEQHHSGYTKGFYSASLDMAMMEVNAPYSTQKVGQRRLPFIFDDVGEWYIWHEAKPWPGPL